MTRSAHHVRSPQDTYEAPDIFQVGVHGHNSGHII